MSWLDATLKKSQHLLERGLDRNVRLAVTGLSGAGKTGFITSLINQLLTAPTYHQLTFFKPNADGRLTASKLAQHPELHIPGFDYHGAIDRLTGNNPVWPASTRGVSQAQIKCRFHVSNKWVKKVQADSTVTIDIIDYPGEWLLDLPLLGMSFKEWCQACVKYLSSERREAFCSRIKSEITALDVTQAVDETSTSNQLGVVAKKYTEALLKYREQHNDFSLALPGRFILPGEFEGAPTLEFFPILNEDILSLDWGTVPANSIIKVLEKRFNYYKNEVIRPFFDEYFSKVDRQIVLIDTCSVLESGYDSYIDLKQTIEKLLDGYSYGRSNWLKRLFSPSIDKLLIATSKVDLVPPDQHAALESFMQKMVAQARNNVGYEGVDVETMAISAISTSEPVITEHDGQKLHCVKGKDRGSGNSVIHYPGKVPETILSRSQWNQLEIDFSPFDIPELNADEPLPHIRMDKVLQYLIGDKFL
ncbi:YcjX family protein [Kangiella marina]|uniref:YcjX family protein n=1 Tax=Kangiella marina TaxID=1079178 RepID=A0ABP8IEI2_9GAMM